MKIRMIRYIGFIAPFIAAFLSGCAGIGDKSYTGTEAALPAMENIALNARSCWFRTGNSKFARYRLAPELQSFSDKPRILIVPEHNPNERPLLVIEATGSPARITAYGPLMQTRLSVKIDKDVEEWSRGGKKCF